MMSTDAYYYGPCVKLVDTDNEKADINIIRLLLYDEMDEYTIMMLLSNTRGVSLVLNLVKDDPLCRTDLIRNKRPNLSATPSPDAVTFLRNNLSAIDWGMLSRNTCPEAVELLEEYFLLIDWKELSKNTSKEAITLLTKHPANIFWREFSGNSSAGEFLVKNQDMIDWAFLSMNPSPFAIYMLKKYPDNIDWDMLCLNTSPEAVEMLINNQEMINWSMLSGNFAAIEFLLENKDKIVWSKFSSNQHPNAVDFLEANPLNINWCSLSGNTSALRLFKNKCDDHNTLSRIYIKELLTNTAIFEYDYAAMWRRCMVFKEDLMKNRFHPDNVPKFADWGFLGHEEDEYELPY